MINNLEKLQQYLFRHKLEIVMEYFPQLGPIAMIVTIESLI